MQYEVTVSVDKMFVWQLPQEDITMELAYKMSQDALRLARSQNIRRFLSDVRGKRNISDILQNYEFAYRDVEVIGYQRDDKIAVVHDADDHSHDFIETASVNAGYQVKLFTQLQAAITWLSA